MFVFQRIDGLAVACFFFSEIDILEPFFFRDGDTQDGLMR
jgi:hypothetical protein